MNLVVQNTAQTIKHMENNRANTRATNQTRWNESRKRARNTSNSLKHPKASGTTAQQFAQQIQHVEQGRASRRARKSSTLKKVAQQIAHYVRHVEQIAQQLAQQTKRIETLHATNRATNQAHLLFIFFICCLIFCAALPGMHGFCLITLRGRMRIIPCVWYMRCM